MIRLVLLSVAVLNVLWVAQGKSVPAGSLMAAFIDVAAACVVDLLNTAWHRRFA